MMIVDEQFITWGVAVLPLLLALLTGWRPLRSSFRLWRRERLISGYGIKRLDNVILDDGLGGEKVIEHLLLTPDGLLVLLPRRCEGSLFGSEKIDNWTQMDGRGKSFHFENPLHQLEELLATVRYHLPGIPLQGRILFSGNCCFPKGRPERLLLLEELKLHEKRVEKAVLPVIDQAWQQLMQSPRADVDGRHDEDGTSSLRLWLALLLVVISVAWLVWRLE